MKTVTKTKILSPAKVQAMIEKRNKEFKAASPAEQRVLIAKDVIAQLKIGSFKPISGTFFKSRQMYMMGDNYFNYHVEEDNFSVQELVLSKKVNDCQCCALGSIALSCTLFKNKVKVSEIDYELDPSYVIEGEWQSGNSKLQLDEIFSSEQLKLIEVAFERGKGYYSSYSLIDGEAARRFGRAYSNHADRLIAIMKNIIKNKGEFKP